MGQFTEQLAVEQFFKNLLISLLQYTPGWEILLDIAVFHRSCNLLKRILPQWKCTEWGKAGTTPRVGVGTIVHLLLG
jgi:hypothetical protein